MLSKGVEFENFEFRKEKIEFSVGVCQELEGIKGYKLFNLQNKKFIYTRSVIFYEQIQSPKYPINLQNIPLIHYVNNREYGKEHVNNMRESLQLEEFKEEEESQEVHKIKIIKNLPNRK